MTQVAIERRHDHVTTTFQAEHVSLTIHSNIDDAGCDRQRFLFRVDTAHRQAELT